MICKFNVPMPYIIDTCNDNYNIIKCHCCAHPFPFTFTVRTIDVLNNLYGITVTEMIGNREGCT